MPYSLDDKLVIGISSSSLFDLAAEDEIFRKEGLEAYKEYQRQNRNVPMKKGAAFSFIQRLLRINEACPEEHPVDVVLMSRNSPMTGVRVFNSIKEYGLDIERAAFMSGGSAVNYLAPFNVALFLTSKEEDARDAIAKGLPAGRIMAPAHEEPDDGDAQLRVAFDFDGVLADDESERVFKAYGLEAYHAYEKKHQHEPLKAGPLADFFRKLAGVRRIGAAHGADGGRLVKTSIVTARSSPAFSRAIETLASWGVDADEMFLMGGVGKAGVLNRIKPHLYFDDQLVHLDVKHSQGVPYVHIPFGVANRPAASVQAEKAPAAPCGMEGVLMAAAGEAAASRAAEESGEAVRAGR